MPKQRRWIILALVLAAGAGLAATSMVGRWSSRGTLPRDRVAVAVFSNRTGDSTLEPLGSMAADWVTRGLGSSELVDVVDLGAVYAQGRGEAGEPVDPVLLARRNGAGTVVSGSYYLATDTLVVRATLVDAASGTVLQTVPPVHAPAGEAVRALDQLRQHVTTALAGVLDVRYASFTSRPSPPRSFSAYQAFIAGQTAYWQGRPAPEVRVSVPAGGRRGHDVSHRRGLARVHRCERGRVRAHRLGRQGPGGSPAGALPVRPAHPRHQRGPLPQRLGRGLSPRQGAGGAPTAVHLRGLYGRRVRASQRALRRRAGLPREHRSRPGSGMAHRFGQDASTGGTIPVRSISPGTMPTS